MASGHGTCIATRGNSQVLSWINTLPVELPPSRMSSGSKPYPSISQNKMFPTGLILTLSQHVPTHCRFFQIRGASIKSPSKHCALPQAKAICRRSPAETAASQAEDSEDQTPSTKREWLGKYQVTSDWICFAYVSHSYHSYWFWFIYWSIFNSSIFSGWCKMM